MWDREQFSEEMLELAWNNAEVMGDLTQKKQRAHIRSIMNQCHVVYAIWDEPGVGWHFFRVKGDGTPNGAEVNMSAFAVGGRETAEAMRRDWGDATPNPGVMH
jgi:hypothetical protein